MEPTVSLLHSHFHNLSVASNYESTITETLASLLTHLVKNGKEYHIKSVGTLQASCPFTFEKVFERGDMNYLAAICVNATDLQMTVSFQKTMSNSQTIVMAFISQIMAAKHSH